MCNYMGHKVSYQDFIRLKQLEKQATVIEAPRPYQTGFDYLDWPVVRPYQVATGKLIKWNGGLFPQTLEIGKASGRVYTDATGKFRPTNDNTKCEG